MFIYIKKTHLKKGESGINIFILLNVAANFAYSIALN